jgi:hypothetical protein
MIWTNAMIAVNYRVISQFYIAVVALFLLLVMPSTLSTSIDRFHNLYKKGAFQPQNVEPIRTSKSPIELSK